MDKLYIRYGPGTSVTKEQAIIEAESLGYELEDILETKHKHLRLWNDGDYGTSSYPISYLEDDGYREHTFTVPQESNTDSDGYLLADKTTSELGIDISRDFVDKDGIIYVMYKDDNSHCPWFRYKDKPNEGTRCIYWYKLKYYNEPDTLESKFKIGDKVVYLGGDDTFYDVTIGKHYTVKELMASNGYKLCNNANIKAEFLKLVEEDDTSDQIDIVINMKSLQGDTTTATLISGSNGSDSITRIEVEELTGGISPYALGSNKSKTILNTNHNKPMATTIQTEAREAANEIYFDNKANKKAMTSMDAEIVKYREVLGEAQSDIAQKYLKLGNILHDYNEAYSRRDAEAIKELNTQYVEIKEFIDNYLENTVKFLGTDTTKKEKFSVTEFFS